MKNHLIKQLLSMVSNVKKETGDTELYTSYWREWTPESFRNMDKIGRMEMVKKSIDLDIWKHNLDTYEIKEMQKEEERYSKTKKKLDILLSESSASEEKGKKEFKKLITQKWELLQNMQKKKIEIFARKHKLKIDESKKEQIIKEIIKRHGFCQSKREQTKDNICPCAEILERITRRGKCRHALFIAGENRRPETKKLDSSYWVRKKEFGGEKV